MQVLTDSYNRIHDYIRISLTDKCNLNCIYCNPADLSVKKLSREEILSYSEILRLIEIFTGKLGVKKVRFTGGEPLVRKDIMPFFESVYTLKLKYGFETALTTNGTLLKEKLQKLKEYGLDKLNISLDTLKPERFKLITGKDKLNEVLSSISKAAELGFKPIKINSVIMKNINDDEIIDLVDLIKDTGANVRFIEFMPFGNNGWNENGFISSQDIRKIIGTKYSLHEISGSRNLVAKNYSIEGYTGTVSFISSISDHFCDRCNRLRIDSLGKMKLCLFSYGTEELNFKEILNDRRSSDQDICSMISNALCYKKRSHPDVQELLSLEKHNMLSIGG